MTQPSNFKENILEIWSFLDTVIFYIYIFYLIHLFNKKKKLPKGSHIIVLGVADGRVLYDTLSNKIHPIGIDYNTFYNFLNCNKKSPCHGWMNTDSDIRDATSKRAMELN
jgi:acyloxyacyl hydrolase